MVKPKIIKKTPISLVKLKEELKSIKKRDEELNFRANKTEQYIENFTLLGKKEHDEAVKKIEKLDIPRLKSEYITKLIDLLPKTKDDLKNILQVYKLTISQDNIKKILDIIKKI